MTSLWFLCEGFVTYFADHLARNRPPLRETRWKARSRKGTTVFGHVAGDNTQPHPPSLCLCRARCACGALEGTQVDSLPQRLLPRQVRRLLHASERGLISLLRYKQLLQETRLKALSRLSSSATLHQCSLANQDFQPGFSTRALRTEWSSWKSSSPSLAENRHSLSALRGQQRAEFSCNCNDGITRAVGVVIVGERASVCRRGEDCVSALRGTGARMLETHLLPRTDFCLFSLCGFLR